MSRLTSLAHFKTRYNLSQTTDDASIDTLIGSVSDRVERYCKRKFLITTYTHHFAYPDDRLQFRLPAYPVSSITSVYVDATGRYNGDESLVPSTSYFLLPDDEGDSRTLVLDPDASMLSQPSSGWGANRLKNLRVQYTGGIAHHQTQFDAVLSGAGTIAAGESVVGVSSAALGTIVTTNGSTTATIAVTRGKFVAGESLTINGDTKTLDTKSTKSLIEEAPSLVDAVELTVRHLIKIAENPGVRTSEGQRTERMSPADMSADYTFLPEVRMLLEPYRCKLIED